LKIESTILEAIGATVVAAETGSEEELVKLAPEVDGILTNWKRVSRKVIGHAPKCKVVSRFGVGLDNIDVSYSTSVGIVVTNVPDYCIEEVSDHALALLLALARRIVFYDRANKSGEYNLQAGTPLYRIKGRTLGIAGFGRIGKMVCQKAKGFGLKVIAYERRPMPSSPLEAEVERVSFNDISIRLPLTPETRHLFNLEAFRHMKPTAVLINTARGDIVNRDALLKSSRRRAHCRCGSVGIEHLVSLDSRKQAHRQQNLFSVRQYELICAFPARAVSALPLKAPEAEKWVVSSDGPRVDAAVVFGILLRIVLGASRLR
jgi:D-3-phosphoglycerate dehydrogenase